MEETNKLELSLKEQILLQVERLGVISNSLESARLNQGVTDRFIEWVEGELLKISVGLEAASHRAERLETGKSKFIPVANILLDTDEITEELMKNLKRCSGRLE